MTDTATTQTIVIVDDEELVVTSLQTFLDLETPYRTVTFTSAKVALQHIQDHDVEMMKEWKNIYDTQIAKKLQNLQTNTKNYSDLMMR